MGSFMTNRMAVQYPLLFAAIAPCYSGHLSPANYASAVVRTDKLPELLIAGAAAFTFLLVAALIHPKGMGMGDVKLAGVMGLYLGASIAPALLVAFLSGSVVGIGLMVRHGAGGRKRGVPFAPFLALGAVVALFAGPQLVHLYVHHFL